MLSSQDGPDVTRERHIIHIETEVNKERHRRTHIQRGKERCKENREKGRSKEGGMDHGCMKGGETHPVQTNMLLQAMAD